MLSILALYNYDPSIFDGLSLPEDLDKATCISTIILQNAELSLVYSDPDTMKDMINAWSVSSQYAWQKLAATLSFEYNPIWNKDGTITETETITGNGTGTQQVSAFDSQTFENRGKTINDTENERTYERVEQGNIGITSTQELIEKERQISEFNIYDQISNDFKNRFCVMVY